MKIEHVRQSRFPVLDCSELEATCYPVKICKQTAAVIVASIRPTPGACACDCSLWIKFQHDLPWKRKAVQHLDWHCRAKSCERNHGANKLARELPSVLWVALMIPTNMTQVKECRREYSRRCGYSRHIRWTFHDTMPLMNSTALGSEENCLTNHVRMWLIVMILAAPSVVLLCCAVALRLDLCFKWS